MNEREKHFDLLTFSSKLLPAPVMAMRRQCGRKQHICFGFFLRHAVLHQWLIIIIVHPLYIPLCVPYVCVCVCSVFESAHIAHHINTTAGNSYKQRTVVAFVVYT